MNDAVRQRLEVEQRTLLDSLEESATATETVELDQTRQGRLSRMDAMQQQAMAQAARQRTVTRLREITAALNRLEAGEYGDCEDCGEPIPPARLEFDLCARRCIDCAEARE